MPKSPQSRVFISVQWMLFASVTVLLTIILTGIFYWFYGFATQQATHQVVQDLTQMARTAALGVNADDLVALAKGGKPNEFGVAWEQAGGDAEAQKRALEKFKDHKNGFSDDPRYLKLLDWLETIHQIEPRAWSYLWVNDDATGEVIYVADLAARYNPEKSPLFLEREEDTNPTTQLTLSMDDNGNLDSYTDNWGSWYSAWAPITDANGKIIGGVGVDFEAGEVDRVQNTIRNIVLIVFITTYIVVFLAVYLIAHTIIHPITALTRAADQVGEGKYDQDFSALDGGYFQNEVSVLARVFSLMVEKTERRVTSLKLKVEELRIEIDQAKRKQQVDEIAGSEFFQDLQAKAQTARRRSSKSALDEDIDEAK
jgi:hypothetical protein